MIYSCPKQALLEVHLIFINEVPLICWISVFFFFFLKNDPNSWLLKVNRNFVLLFRIQKHFTKNVTCSLQMYIFKICQSQFFTSSLSPLSLSLYLFSLFSPFPLPMYKSQCSVLAILFLKVK